MQVINYIVHCKLSSSIRERQTEGLSNVTCTGSSFSTQRDCKPTVSAEKIAHIKADWRQVTWETLPKFWRNCTRTKVSSSEAWRNGHCVPLLLTLPKGVRCNCDCTGNVGSWKTYAGNCERQTVGSRNKEAKPAEICLRWYIGCFFKQS